MNISRKNILVTGARAPVALHLCRILKEAGMQVYAGDCIPYALGKSSNSIEDYILLPSPVKDADLFVNTLISKIQELNIDTIIPTCEESFYLSLHKEKLSAFCDVLVGDFHAMKLLHNKFSFIQYINSLNLPSPKTVLFSRDNNISHAEELSNQPIVLKKVYSRFSDNVLFLESTNDIPDEILHDKSPWIIQERIKGTQFCSYGVARNGELLAHSVYKTEFTAGLGATISFEHTDRPDIKLFVRSVVKHLNFTGQISFDFIVNENDHAIPIECNPRATSGLHLFGKEIVESLLEKTANTIYPKALTKESIILAMLLYGPSNIKKGKTIKQWIQVMLSHKDITFRKNDLKPFFYQFASMFRLWINSRRNQNSILEQSTYDIRWDGEEK